MSESKKPASLEKDLGYWDTAQLGRDFFRLYAHRLAITNRRLISADVNTVAFL